MNIRYVFMLSFLCRHDWSVDSGDACKGGRHFLFFFTVFVAACSCLAVYVAVFCCVPQSTSIQVSSHCYQCNASWYTGNKQVHEDLGVSFLYRPHQISERFDSKLADVGNHLVTEFGRYLRWPSVDPSPLKPGDRDRQLVGLPVICGYFDTLIRAQLALFDYTEVSLRAFPQL